LLGGKDLPYGIEASSLSNGGHFLVFLKAIEAAVYEYEYQPSNGVNTPWAKELSSGKWAVLEIANKGSLRETEK